MSDFIPGMTLDELIADYPGLGYSVAATELQTDRARRNYAIRYGEFSSMQTRIRRAELIALLGQQKGLDG